MESMGSEVPLFPSVKTLRSMQGMLRPVNGLLSVSELLARENKHDKPAEIGRASCRERV